MIERDRAVSPVVGVMLMLVVTIVIAAIVSGFAGGLAGSQEKVPQASVAATEFVIKGVIDLAPENIYGQDIPRPDQGSGNPAADIYVVFQHKGGDAFNLDKAEVYLSKLSEPQVGTYVSRSLTPQTGPAFNTSQGDFGTIGLKSAIPGWSQGWTKYIEKYPDRNSTVITPGEMFVLHADYSARTGGTNPTNCIGWLKKGGSYAFTINQGDVLTFDIIDSNSKKVIASGQILVPEFTVVTS